MSLSWLITYSLLSQFVLFRFLPNTLIIAPIFALAWGVKKLQMPSLLLLALFLGLFFDLFSSSLPVGSHPLIFILSALIIRQFHHYFYDDKLITITVLSLTFSLFTNLFTIIVHIINSQIFQINPLFVVSEIIIPSLLDAVFCIISTLIFKATLPVIKWIASKFTKRINPRAI
ncbi:MAG: hypothetical protein P0S95_01395 [Rhabdochlamydiaceae bacterium]|nr:hypothetical protein [Candidatus Amphrikana amoebophyrae]